jgi:hypothetical protein
MPDRRSAGALLLLQPRTWAVPYVALWFAVGLLPFQPTDMDIFFWPSADIAVSGHPLLVYQAHGQSDYPNANGPVSLVPLAALGVALKAVGLAVQPWRRAFALALFSIFFLLMAREALLAVESIRGAPVTGYARLGALATLSLGPPLWQSLAGYGHVEQPIELWLLLLAARRLDERRTLGAGVAFALGVLSRSPAILLGLPLAVYAGRRGFGSLVRFGAATAVTGGAVLAPFVLADPSDVVHSLFTYRRELMVGAGSVWSLVHGTAVETLVQHWDIVPILIAVLASNAWLATRPGGMNLGRLFAAMTLTAACFALFAKTVWPYYLTEVFVFGSVWAFGRWSTDENPVRLAFLPLAISVYALVAEIGSEQGIGQYLVDVEGGCMFALLGLTAAWVAWRAGGPRRPEQPGSRGAARAAEPESAR